jgi:hypothetical protein
VLQDACRTFGQVASGTLPQHSGQRGGNCEMAHVIRTIARKRQDALAVAGSPIASRWRGEAEVRWQCRRRRALRCARYT